MLKFQVRKLAGPMLVAMTVAAALAPCARVAAAEPLHMTAMNQREILGEALAAFDRATQLSQTDQSAARTEYQRAADDFESLISAGVQNGKLYYNLGNTYLQIGELGRAIANYRRAETLIGNDPQLQANLRYARSLRRTQIEPSGQRALLHTIFFWHFDTSAASRYYVALAAYALFWLLLIIYLFRRLPGLRTAAVVMLVVWLSAGASVAVETVQNRTMREGVTTADEVVVRKGNGEAYDPQFREPIHEGVEFIILEERSGWYRIELPNGSEGWIPTSRAVVI